jgi:glutaredoxin-like YruB-family protein
MKITIYTLPTCPHCIRAKEFLTKHKIKFKNKDVSNDEKALQEMIKKSGQQGVPVIDIEGKIITGFNEEELKKVLKI